MERNSFSLEATSRTIAELISAASGVPAGTPVNVAWLDNEADHDRLRTVRLLDDAGLLPVPIIAARRVQSKKHLFDLTEKLRFAGVESHFMVVGGDPSQAAGPFNTAIDLLSTEWIEKYAIKCVTLPGFPEGNVAIGYRSDVSALVEKVELLDSYGCDANITTQLAFDPARILSWIGQLRSAGIHKPIRIGIPGPAKQEILLRFARTFGVSARGLNNVTIVEGDRFQFTPLLELIDQGLKQRGFDNVGVHLYPFGGTKAAVQWFAGTKADPEKLNQIAATA